MEPLRQAAESARSAVDDEEEHNGGMVGRDRLHDAGHAPVAVSAFPSPSSSTTAAAAADSHSQAELLPLDVVDAICRLLFPHDNDNNNNSDDDESGAVDYEERLGRLTSLLAPYADVDPLLGSSLSQCSCPGCAGKGAEEKLSITDGLCLQSSPGSSTRGMEEGGEGEEG